MELFLNLVWLFTTIGLFGSLWWQQRHAPQCRGAGAASNPTRLITAIVLSFVLLPVISMTDDLHATATMAESERTDRRIIGVLHHQVQRCPVLHSGLAALALRVENPQLHCETFKPHFAVLRSSQDRSPLHSDRAPPKN